MIKWFLRIFKDIWFYGYIKNPPVKSKQSPSVVCICEIGTVCENMCVIPVWFTHFGPSTLCTLYRDMWMCVYVTMCVRMWICVSAHNFRVWIRTQFPKDSSRLSHMLVLWVVVGSIFLSSKQGKPFIQLITLILFQNISGSRIIYHIWCSTYTQWCKCSFKKCVYFDIFRG